MSYCDTTVATVFADNTLSPHLHLDTSLGAALIGLVFASILFGVTNNQALIYWQTYKCDPKYLKLMIAFLWFLDVLQVALAAQYTYFVLITNFANLSATGKVTWSMSTHVVASEISDFVIRLYYSRRIWIISDRKLLMTAIAISVNFIALAFGIGFAGKLFSFDSIVEVQTISWVMYTALGSGVAADLWTTASLCYLLRRDTPGFQTTGTLLNKLTVYIVNTGLLTSFWAICCFVTYAAMSRNAIFVAIYSCLSRLYFNALLATLNSRKQLREAMVAGTGTDLERVVRVSLAAGKNLRSDDGNSTTNGGLRARTGSVTGEKANSDRSFLSAVLIRSSTETTKTNCRAAGI